MVSEYDIKCDCGRALIIKSETQSSGPNNAWTRDVPYIVSEAQCSEGHTPFLLKRRGTLQPLFEQL